MTSKNRIALDISVIANMSNTVHPLSGLICFTIFLIISLRKRVAKKKIIEKYHREMRQPKWMIGCKDKSMGGANLIA